jgi:ATP-dependent exoDNAse (exonuclease V) alpha subunit
VLLVGDWAQLSSLEAGGAFAMLVNDRSDPSELSEVRRFQHDWERTGSVQLRAGDPAAIDAYAEHDRIKSSDRNEMLDALYRAWRDDVARGLTSLMIAGDGDSVTELNLRARAERVASGEVNEVWVEIAGRAIAGAGDRVVTRQNNRRLLAGTTWVKNGDVWTVRAVGSDGAITVQRENGSGVVTLPAEYARIHVELGYAATVFRAQGRTVDTAHSLVGATASRESLYVAATRGRQANTLYVDLETDPDDETSHGDTEHGSAGRILRAVLDRSSADTAAHTALERRRPDTGATS